MKRLCLRAEFADRLVRGAVPVVVTGATGWLGLALLEMLDDAFGAAMPARVTAFASGARTILLRSGRRLAARAFSGLADFKSGPALVFHLAFRTRGYAGEPDYEAVNRSISAAMRRFIEANGALGLLVPSSGAVYRAGGGGGSNLAGNPYGVLKLEDEAIFGGLATRLGFPAAIMRIFNLAGPFINNLNGYALACVIADIGRGGPITLRAAHPVWRSYTHVEDVLNIAAAIMLRGLPVPVFDAAGEVPVEIGELAVRAAALLGAETLAIERPAWRGGVADRYVGDIECYRRVARLAGVELQTLDRQILDTAGFMLGFMPG